MNDVTVRTFPCDAVRQHTNTRDDRHTALREQESVTRVVIYVALRMAGKYNWSKVIGALCERLPASPVRCLGPVQLRGGGEQ